MTWQLDHSPKGPCSAIASILLTLALSGIVQAQQQTLRVSIPMRDGVKLSTDVYLPGNGRYPALLVRTPYNKGGDLLAAYRVFLTRGFALVIQDVRGRYASQGVFNPPVQEVADGDDTLNWVARQRWCEGGIGMLGGSYVGIVQWKAAISGNRHLKAIFPVVSGNDEYLDRFYSRGGALKLGHRLLWMSENLRLPTHRLSFEQFVKHLPLRTADVASTGRTIPFFQEALDHPAYDSYWKSRSTRAKLDSVKVPAFVVTGWYDNYAQSDLDTFAALSKRSGAHRILVGPWGHNMSVPFPGVSFGPDSSIPIRRLQIDWFTRWLKPARSNPPAEAPVRIFVMGVNRWREEQEWPPLRAQDTPFYLSSNKSAVSSSGDGALLPAPNRRAGRDEYTYDPARPVPTRGGAVCCNPKIFPWGPMDQSAVEARQDVLVYSTPVLKNDVEVTGNVKAVLFVSTTAADTDFTVKLVDVFPDGHARNLTDGILRMRYRESLEKPSLAPIGQEHRIVVDVGVTSNVFLAGHRIRVEVSSSNFPRFDRNANTGGSIANERKMQVARQTINHGRTSPSHIVLPLVPAISSQ